MKPKNLLFFAMLLSVTFAFTACDETDSSNDDSDPNTAEITDSLEANETEGHFDEIPDHATDAEIASARLKFVGFELGDASHYLFEDEAGEQWDFAACEGKNCDFGVQLSEEESDESNQGWGSNTELEGEWFNVEYYETERELYIDGPIGKVMIISETEPAE